MLRKSERITFTGESVIGDQVVCAFSASIDVDEPEKMTIGQVQRDKEAYKANREECRADFAAFEDAVLARQAEFAPISAFESVKK